MKKINKNILLLGLIFLGIVIGHFMSNPNFSTFFNVLFSSNILWIFLCLIFLFILFNVSGIILGKRAGKELKNRDKLFHSLVKNSDTVYLMCDSASRQIIYMTQNI